MGFKNRREFLKKASQWGTAGFLGSHLPFLSSCSTVDQYFTPSTQFLTDRVVIVGAGLAGLAAAYELKKNKIPYCLFEGQRNCGGRISTVKFMNHAGQIEIHEMGADFFDRRHSRVFQLAKDLGLKVEEQDEGLDTALAIGGRISRDSTPLQPYFQRIAQDRLNLFNVESGDILPESSAASFDQMSVVDYLRSKDLVMDSRVESAFHKSIEQIWGASPREISALQFIFQFDHESPHSPFSTAKRFRIVGGNQELIDRLLVRVDSLVPNFLLRLEHQLVAIRSRTLMYELVFKTPEGEKTFYCNKLLVALPLGKLREIDGWSSLGAHSDFTRHIENARMSHHAKASLAFKQKFWSKKVNPSVSTSWFQGQVLGDWSLQNLAEVARRTPLDSDFGSSKNSGLDSGSLLIQNGDRSQKNFLNEIISKPSRGLTSVWPESEKFFDRLVAFRDWSEHQGVQGSKAIFGPSQFLSRNEVWKQTGLGEGIRFAGEHLSHQWPGTMEGALASAYEAVQMFKSLPQGRG